MVVVETGDGQVAGLPGSIAPEAFYRALSDAELRDGGGGVAGEDLDADGLGERGRDFLDEQRAYFFPGKERAPLTIVGEAVLDREELDLSPPASERVTRWTSCMLGSVSWSQPRGSALCQKVSRSLSPASTASWPSVALEAVRGKSGKALREQWLDNHWLLHGREGLGETSGISAAASGASAALAASASSCALSVTSWRRQRRAGSESAG